MKRGKAGRRLAVALIVLLVPALGYTAGNVWKILKQSGDERATFETLSRQVARDAEQAGRASGKADTSAIADQDQTSPERDDADPRSDSPEPKGEGAKPTPTERVTDGARESDDGPAAEASVPRTVLAQYQSLIDQNADFFGWIRIDDTKIDYPVMFTPREPEYYLHRDFYKKYSYSGTPFVEGHCAETGNYYIVYAHHMRDGGMFGGLPRYEKREYCEAHPIIRFDTRYESRAYQVLAAFKSRVYRADEKDAFKYYEYTDLSDPARFEAYMSGVRRAALYDTGVEAAFGDELLALSTCNYHTRNGRFVVVAKRVK